MLIGYASRTGTRRNLKELRTRGWRLLLSPPQEGRYPPGPPTWDDGSEAPYCLDNGAWSCFQNGEPFDDVAFSRFTEAHGEGADWVVLPDMVGGGLRSLDMSLSWVDRLAGLRLLLAVQDGMTLDAVREAIPAGVGLFVGGTTEWKWSTVDSWAALGHELGCVVHVARVNSARAIHRCHNIGATSFDGTNLTRYACNAERLDSARTSPVSRQIPLLMTPPKSIQLEKP